MDTHETVEIPRNIKPPNTTKALEEIKTDLVETKTNKLQAPQYVKKKMTLLKFKRMIKKGSFVSARLSAKILKVDKRTIEQWLLLPVIQEVLASEVHDFTSKIRKSKDWKAQAYLLDKIIDEKTEEGSKTDLRQLIVINS